MHLWWQGARTGRSPFTGRFHSANVSLWKPKIPGVLPEAQSCGLLCWCCSSSWQRRCRIAPPQQCCCTHWGTFVHQPLYLHIPLAASCLAEPQTVPRRAAAAAQSRKTCPWSAPTKEKVEEKNCEVEELGGRAKNTLAPVKWEYTFPLELLSHSLLHCFLVSLPARLLVKCTAAKVSFFLNASLTQPTLLCSLPSYHFTALDIVFSLLLSAVYQPAKIVNGQSLIRSKCLQLVRR